MKDLSSLLARISRVLGSDVALKLSVCEAVKECIGADISEKAISIKNSVLYIEASPALKSELNFKKDKVLECIREKSGTKLRQIIYC